MKPTEPNNSQKRILMKNNMDPEHWLFLEEDKYQIVFINKRKSRRRVIHKEILKRRNLSVKEQSK